MKDCEAKLDGIASKVSHILGAEILGQSELTDHFAEVLRLLKQNRDLGGSQLETYQCIEKIGSEFDEKTKENESRQDFIWDLPAAILGHCPPERRIWSAELGF